MNKKTILYIVILLFPILIGVALNIALGWSSVFDDAFITYRYSMNLAQGHGITWNPGMAPTEGYTNFLLVVFLAPFIKVGIDPLLVTRLVSYLSALAMASLLFTVAKKTYNGSTRTSTMIALLILIAPQTRQLCLVGLETVIYSFFLLVTFHFGSEFLLFRRTKTAVFLGVLIILTMLLRPEATFLYLMITLLFIPLHIRSVSDIKPLAQSLLVAFTLGIIYLIWKLIHFGQLLPNPFYIKVAGNSFISELGLHSVTTFFRSQALLLTILCVGHLLLYVSKKSQNKHRNKISFLLGLGLTVIYSIFFIHTDTLMDIHGRFLYPLLPIIIYVSLPVFTTALTAIERWTDQHRFSYPFVLIGFLLIFNSEDLLNTRKNIQRLASIKANGTEIDNSLMYRELRLAKSLAQYPNIQRVCIAFGDAGVVPYYTRSIWLDVVGLNDGVIAKMRDKKSLVTYFFSVHPDLAILPGHKDFSWLQYGHGPLGNYASWVTDPRWDDYTYAGTCKTSGIYDLQLFVNQSSPFYKSLTYFLQKEVVDGQYSPFPYNIGTEIPDPNIESEWIPCSGPRDRPDHTVHEL